MAKRGRPPKFVKDENGHPIVGLSYSKHIKSYYATYSKPRKYFGTDFSTALHKFYKYQTAQKGEEPYCHYEIPRSQPYIDKTGFVEWGQVPLDPIVVHQATEGEVASIPEKMIVDLARKLILEDPIAAKKKALIEANIET